VNVSHEYGLGLLRIASQCAFQQLPVLFYGLRTTAICGNHWIAKIFIKDHLVRVN